MDNKKPRKIQVGKETFSLSASQITEMRKFRKDIVHNGLSIRSPSFIVDVLKQLIDARKFVKYDAFGEKEVTLDRNHILIESLSISKDVIETFLSNKIAGIEEITLLEKAAKLHKQFVVNNNWDCKAIENYKKIASIIGKAVPKKTADNFSTGKVNQAFCC